MTVQERKKLKKAGRKKNKKNKKKKSQQQQQLDNVKAIAEAEAEAEQVEEVEEEEEEGPISAALEAARIAEELGPWGQENTVLVDDSVAKARLQPYNHLLIPEFGKRDAAMMTKFIQQQLAGLASEGQEGEKEGELEYDSDLSLPPTNTNTAPALADTDGGIEAVEDANDAVDEAHEDQKQHKKPIPESRLDDVLLQTIGVLETLRYQANVSAFIRAGGIKGYGEPKTALNEHQEKEKEMQGNTPEYWSAKGRQTCEQLGIEVKAWVEGEAANATAALLVHRTA